MDEQTALLIEAAASVASFVVALVAVVVAIWATRVSKRAGLAADRQAAAADASVASGRRQVLLASAPYLAVSRPTVRWDEPHPRLVVRVENGGQSVAYGVIATAMAAKGRDQPIPEIRAESGRQAALAPGASMPLFIPAVNFERSAGHGFSTGWLVIVIEHYSPLGVRVRTTYEWKTDPAQRVLRTRSVQIDPADGGELMSFELQRGSSDPV